MSELSLPHAEEHWCQAAAATAAAQASNNKDGALADFPVCSSAATRAEPPSSAAELLSSSARLSHPLARGFKGLQARAHPQRSPQCPEQPPGSPLQGAARPPWAGIWPPLPLLLLQPLPSCLRPLRSTRRVSAKFVSGLEASLAHKLRLTCFAYARPLQSSSCDLAGSDSLPATASVPHCASRCAAAYAQGQQVAPARVPATASAASLWQPRQRHPGMPACV